MEKRSRSWLDAAAALAGAGGPSMTEARGERGEPREP